MKTTLPLVLLLTLPSLLQAAPDKSTAGSIAAADSNNVIARVGNLDVKLEEVKTALAKLDQREQDAITKDPALLNQVVRLLLVQRLMLNEATSKKWDEKPQVKIVIERARESAITESYLQSVSKAPEASDADLQTAYDGAKDQLLVPKQYRVSQIFITVAKGSDKATEDKAKARVDALVKALKAPSADFAALARLESEHKESKESGGDLGLLTEARMQPEIRAKVATLAKGAVTEPIRLDDGYHIIKVVEIKESYTPAFAEVKPQIATQLRAERTKAAAQAYVTKLLQANPIAINELGLAKILTKPKE